MLVIRITDDRIYEEAERKVEDGSSSGDESSGSDDSSSDGDYDDNELFQFYAKALQNSSKWYRLNLLAIDEIALLDNQYKDEREDSIGDQDDDKSSNRYGNEGIEAADACGILQLYEKIVQNEGE